MSKKARLTAQLEKLREYQRKLEANHYTRLGVLHRKYQRKLIELCDDEREIIKQINEIEDAENETR